MKRTALAAVFVQPGQPLEVREFPVVDPPPGFAQVELVTSGICGTDVHIWEGAISIPGPFIPGHEFLGRIAAMNEPPGENSCDCLGRPIAEGDLVAVNVIEPCGTCVLCQSGGAASCLRLMESLTYIRNPDEPPHFHGGYAEMTYCPIRYLHRFPDALPADVASVFLCAGPTVVRAMHYGEGLRGGEHVVIQGSGPVGLFATLWAAHHGAATVTLIGSSSRPERLSLAAELGASHVFDIRTSSVEERRRAIQEITDGLGADLVIEASGSPDAVPEGLVLLRPRGKYLLAGQYSDRGAVPVPVHVITFQALQVLGSAQFTAEDREDYFNFLLAVPQKWDTIRRLITHRFPVARANEALQAVQAGQAVKALLAA